MPNDPECVEFSVPRDTFYLALIRGVTADLARHVGFEDEQIDLIEMAIDEACANAMLYQSQETRPVDLRVEMSAQRFAVTLTDHGSPFDFETGGDIDLDDHNESACPNGMGIFIIKSFMDEVTYQHRAGFGNVLHMVKNRQSAPLSSRC